MRGLAATAPPGVRDGAEVDAAPPGPAGRLMEWRGAELWDFGFDHAFVDGDALTFSPSESLGGTDADGRYNGGTFVYAVATSPEIETARPFSEAIASWHAETPPGSWIEVDVLARIGGTWTKPYVMGIWSSGNEAFARHSVTGQGDADGDVATDTLVLSGDADAFQVTVKLFAEPGAEAPRLHAVALATSGTPGTPAGDPSAWGVELAVPTRSQMIYADGGEVWCSPTSTSMILAFWGKVETVPQAASSCYDSVYGGTGNWSFNVAHAADVGDGALRAVVLRLDGMEELETLIAAGLPAVLSASWSSGDIDGAAIDSTAGHILVARGFDADGDLIVNDPAGDTNDQVRHVYAREQIDAAWRRSGRTIYLIHPVDQPSPF
jgi:hypothetical protein